MICDASIYTFYVVYINIPRLLILNSWLKNIRENLRHHLSREK